MEGGAWGAMSEEPRSTEPRTWREWKQQQKALAELLSWEWASEWIVYWSRNWEFVKFLELLGKFAIVVAVVSWVIETGDRQKAKHYRAWELINSAKTGDGGRLDALRDLNEDGVSLAAAPLANAELTRLQL